MKQDSHPTTGGSCFSRLSAVHVGKAVVLAKYSVG